MYKSMIVVMLGVVLGGVSGCALIVVSHQESVPPSAAETKEETLTGRDVLERSAKALGKVRVASYQAEYTSTGWVKPFVAEVRGSVTLGDQSKWEIDRFHCKVDVKKNGEDQAMSYEAGSDGEDFFLIDPRTRVVHQDMDPLVLGDNGRDLQRVLMRPYSAPKPFEEELKADSIELQGTETVAGVSCYQVRVKPTDSPEFVWSIAKRDFLPRRAVRIYANRRDPDGEPGTTQLTIRDLKINPEFDHDPFKLRMPAGFTKTDEFPD